MADYKPGDKVYSVNGAQLEYVAKQYDGHIAREVVDDGDGDGEYALGSPRLYGAVYMAPPVARYEKEIAGQLEKLSAAQEELTSVLRQTAEARTERTKTLAAFAKDPDLEPVIAYLEGRLTHAVLLANCGGEFRIVPLFVALTPGEDSNRRKGEVRLLALYGGTFGPDGKEGYSGHRRPGEWRINTYSDGSGLSHEKCLLATSEQDALKKLQAYLDREFQLRNVHDKSTLTNWAASAMKLGLTVPDDLAIAARDAARQRISSAISRSADRVRSAEKALEMARAELKERQEAGNG